ncbi:outer membrane protein transport protein [Thauera sp.]|jgi:long-chain fatty acid transport protein|uniref:OmpP1/FadL family transporter n=1 Tax=Thauera sp. TaxID=1905334 RepID=UPI00261D038F|nr:outer membrane protein transport protein [Thauera sp.]
MQKTLIARVLPAALLALASGTASAAGFQLLEQNASGIGNAYAGSAAVAENASTIFFNPAGMTQLQAREMSVGLSLVRPSFKFTDQGSSAGVLSGNAQDAGDWAALPNAYLSWALNKDLYVGVGMGAPFGLVTEYNRDWIGSAHSIKFDIKTININPSIAWRVNEKVSLGFGVNWQRMEAEYVRRAGIVDLPAGAGGVPIPRPLSQSFATLDADDDSWGWNVGALFTVSDATKVGVSYRSKIKHELEGSLSVAGPNPVFNTVGSSGANATVELPDIFIFSVAHKLDPKWELLGDVSWTGWSSVDKVDIMRSSGALAQTLDTDFQDTWRVALGANYQLNDAWKLKFGVAFDETPVKNAEKRLTSLPDNDRIWFSVGGQWKASKASTLDMGVSYLYVDDTKINNGSPADLQKGLVKGEYDSSVWILGAQYSMSF